MCGIFIICNINFINYDILPIRNILKKKKKWCIVEFPMNWMEDWMQPKEF